MGPCKSTDKRLNNQGEDFLATVLTDPERPSLGRFLSLYRVPTTTAEFLTVLTGQGTLVFEVCAFQGAVS